MPRTERKRGVDLRDRIGVEHDLVRARDLVDVRDLRRLRDREHRWSARQERERDLSRRRAEPLRDRQHTTKPPVRRAYGRRPDALLSPGSRDADRAFVEARTGYAILPSDCAAPRRGPRVEFDITRADRLGSQLRRRGMFRQRVGTTQQVRSRWSVLSWRRLASHAFLVRRSHCSGAPCRQEHAIGSLATLADHGLDAAAIHRRCRCEAISPRGGSPRSLPHGRVFHLPYRSR